MVSDGASDDDRSTSPWRSSASFPATIEFLRMVVPPHISRPPS